MECVENVGRWLFDGFGSDGDRDACSESEGGFIGLLLSSLIGGDAVPSSLWVLDPSPPFVVITPLVLDGGRTLSSDLACGIESPGDWDRDLFRESIVVSVIGMGEEELTGAIVNDPVTEDGE